MTSPIGFGDAYQLSRLAFKLGKAFTKGRKSAPAEFREVENQLYSLTVALQAFQDHSQTSRRAINFPESTLPQPSCVGNEEESDVLSHVIESCRNTLKHLEGIVEKYNSISKPSRDPQVKVPKFRKWHNDITTCWKTIKWTTEGGDLASLRSNLTIHTNSLNLLLGVIVSSQTERIENQVDHIQRLLLQVHAWFVENVQGATIGQHTVSQENEKCGGLDFELYTDSNGQSRLVCRHATVAVPELSLSCSGPFKGQQALFACKCAVSSPGYLSHKEEVAAFGLSPLSFCTRVAGNEWVLMFYKATNKATNRLTSLLLKRMSRTGMADTEELFLQYFTLQQSKLMIQKQMNTMLCHLNQTESGQKEVRILNAVRDAKAIKSKVKSVNFSSGNHLYGRGPPQFVQILHYKSIALEDLAKDHRTLYRPFCFEEIAEVILYFHRADSSDIPIQDTDIVRMTLHLNSSTRVEFDSNQEAVVFDEIDCTGYTASDEAHPMTHVRTTMHFVDFVSCREFKQIIEDMRMELFVLRLQYTGRDERKILHFQAYNIYTEDWHIPHAEISILENTRTSKFRLSIVSRDGYSVFSQELPENFFKSSADGTHPSFNHPSFLIEIDNHGRRKTYSYPNGCTIFGFSNAEDERLFHLCLTNFASKAPALPDRTMATENSILSDD